MVETKVSALQTDLSRIGGHIHSINNEVTKISISEQKCQEWMTTMSATFERFEAKLTALMADQAQRQGMGAFIQRFCLIAGACAAMVAVIGFMVTHLRFG